MLVLGLILILIAVLVMVAFLVGGANDPGSLVIGTTFTWSPGAAMIFLTGVVTLLVLTVGFVLLQSGVRRARQHRRDVRELERQVAQRASEGGRPGEVTDATGARHADRGSSADQSAGPPEAPERHAAAPDSGPRHAAGPEEEPPTVPGAGT